MKQPVICLSGTTATGKSDLAIALSEIFPVEIISVDSAMVYRGLDIGTAKPDPAILASIPHHLINIRELDSTYSVGDFCKDALMAIQAIIAKKKIPLLAGGTMLYFKALQQGLSVLPPEDKLIRQRIYWQAEKHGWAYLYQWLTKIDPVTAQRLHPNDTQRIQRALEVYEITGKPLSQFFYQTENLPYLNLNNANYRIINIGLIADNKNLLKKRISQRLENMLKKGFIAEVKSILQQYPDQALPASLRAVGYREICRYLQQQKTNPTDADQVNLAQQIITATGQLAKRQLTWLKNPKHWRNNMTFFDSDLPELYKTVIQFLRNQAIG